MVGDEFWSGQKTYSPQGPFPPSRGPQGKRRKAEEAPLPLEQGIQREHTVHQRVVSGRTLASGGVAGCPEVLASGNFH